MATIFPPLLEGVLRVFGTQDLSKIAAATQSTLGGYDRNCARSKAYIRQSIPEPFQLPTWEDNQAHCVCGHKLKIVHIAYLIGDPSINAIIGSCCILEFPHRFTRVCSGCGTLHKNRADNYCGACRAHRIEQATAVAARASATALSTQRASVIAGQASARAAGSLERLRTHIHACIGCGAKGVKIPFVKCYNCNAAALTGKCSTCSKPCRPAYKKCWGCK